MSLHFGHVTDTQDKGQGWVSPDLVLTASSTALLGHLIVISSDLILALNLVRGRGPGTARLPNHVNRGLIASRKMILWSVKEPRAAPPIVGGPLLEICNDLEAPASTGTHLGLEHVEMSQAGSALAGV